MMLDIHDLKLLQLLQQNAKRTTKEYAHRLGLSTTAVYERIKKLERQGMVLHYVALLDKKKVALDFVVFCHVRLTRHTQANIGYFEREVMKLPEVMECHHLSGDYDYLLKIVVRDMEAYRHFMVAKLTAIEHIGSTQSSFTIKEVKHTTALPLLP
ncbi:Lrp/AsnC family transcriptional regulator [Maribacter sp. 2307ULW6-5]|uniref:Lrp/AsnC family transcriptional regulator n=1 Tax=Maribacter sp. 2307ULW6-5 TaxID=3386275 RepID=UPI0039BCD56D